MNDPYGALKVAQRGTQGPENIDWTQAVCREWPTDMFFPDEGDRYGINFAKSLCAGCPLKTACLERALDGDERYGIWGGKTERERRGLNRRRHVVEPCAVGSRAAYQRHVKRNEECATCREFNTLQTQQGRLKAVSG